MNLHLHYNVTLLFILALFYALAKAQSQIFRNFVSIVNCEKKQNPFFVQCIKAYRCLGTEKSGIL